MNDPVSQSPPMPRRRAPALLGVALLLGCLATLVWQTARLLELRRENAALRAGTAGLDQLREENAELQRLRTAAQDAERAQKEKLELAKLRTEVAQLLTVAQELPALRAERERLQAERTAAAARAGVVAEVDPFAAAKGRAQRISCINNIKQICRAARIWENEHKDLHALPVNFLIMSNELNTPKILTCAGDTGRTKANTWQEFDGSSVSYELLSPGADSVDPSVVYVRCLIHNNVGMADGSAQQLDPALDRIEKVDGKFRIVRLDAQP
jgi:hypothetical protein